MVSSREHHEVRSRSSLLMIRYNSSSRWCKSIKKGPCSKLSRMWTRRGQIKVIAIFSIKTAIIRSRSTAKPTDIQTKIQAESMMKRICLLRLIQNLQRLHRVITWSHRRRVRGNRSERIQFWEKTKPWSPKNRAFQSHCSQISSSQYHF